MSLHTEPSYQSKRKEYSKAHRRDKSNITRNERLGPAKHIVTVTLDQFTEK